MELSHIYQAVKLDVKGRWKSKIVGHHLWMIPYSRKCKLWAFEIRDTYSHLSNKRGDILIDFEFFSTLHVYWFLSFFHPPLLIYCSYVLVFSKKIPPSMFIPTSYREMRTLKFYSWHFFKVLQLETTLRQPSRNNYWSSKIQSSFTWDLQICWASYFQLGPSPRVT